jgi:riboflavin synthase
MFTGLIEAVGHVTALDESPAGLTLAIATPLAPALTPGDSIAVNGVCLTVTGSSGDVMRADIGPETRRVTALGRVRVGQPVNLERPLLANGRVGGHYVQGHVDGTAPVEAIRSEGDVHWLTLGYPAHLEAFLIPKGSIAVDGISLTIAALRDGQFDVMIVPFTWSHTHLPSLRVDDAVNLECDMIGKYVARAAQLALEGRRS